MDKNVDVELERAVVSCALNNDGARAKVLARLRADSFVSLTARAVFDAIAALDREGVEVGAVSVAARMERDGTLARIGGRAELVSLSNNYFLLHELDADLDILVRKAITRCGAREAERALAQFSDCDDPEEVAARLQGVVDAVYNESARYSGGLTSIYEAMERAMRQRATGGDDGVEIGVELIDRETGGFRPGQLVVLGARPAVGKSAVAMSMALAAAKRGTAVVYFSLEMTNEELGERAISGESGVNLRKLRDASADLNEWERGAIASALEDARGLKFHLQDRAETSVSQMKSEARLALRGEEKGLLVVDYLQLIRPTGPNGMVQNRVNEVSGITRALKVMAKELGVPVLLLSQLNRASETDSRPPRLSDLRDSGSIEQDADVVILLSRAREEEGSDGQRVLRINVAKNRGGPVGEGEYLFDGGRMRLTPMPSICFED